MNYAAIILDIEGTVCPISFVKDTLFPYFLSKVPELCRDFRNSATSSQFTHLLSLFPCDGSQLESYIVDIVERDIKDPVLKQLQGLVWKQGYESGEIKAPVYSDAIDFIRGNAPRVYIYSSGSVQAQKLLFGFVDDKAGSGSTDLNAYISGYFDITTSGRKTEAQSYANILKAIKLDSVPGKVLFLSDNPLELDAARSLGIVTKLVLRPGNYPVQDLQSYESVSDFGDLWQTKKET